MPEEAIEIAATQTKSACADWVITGVSHPDFVLIIIPVFYILMKSIIFIIPLIILTIIQS
jgi:hypothetical protein